MAKYILRVVTEENYESENYDMALRLKADNEKELADLITVITEKAVNLDGYSVFPRKINDGKPATV